MASFLIMILFVSCYRNLPHGVCFPFKNDSKDDSSDNKSDINSVDGVVKSGEQNVQLSAAALRHTYNQDFSQFGEKVVALTKRTYTRHFKDKTVRSIRLRPRQTLCSKCKSACHDNADPTSSSISKAPFSSLNNSSSSYSSSSSNSLPSRISHPVPTPPPPPPPPPFPSPTTLPLTTRNNLNTRNHSLIHNTRSRSPPVTRNRQQQQQLQQQVPPSSSVVNRYCQPPPSPKTPRYEHPPPSPKTSRYNQPPPSPKPARYNHPPPSPKQHTHGGNQPPPSPRATRYNQPPPSPRSPYYNQPPPSPKNPRYNQPPPSPKPSRYNQPPPSPKPLRYNQPPPSPKPPHYNQPPMSPRGNSRYSLPPPSSPKPPRFNQPPPSPKPPRFNQPPPSPRHLSSPITLPLPQPQVQLEPLKLGEHPETRSESRKRKGSVTEEYVPTTNDNKTNISLKSEGLTVVKSSPIIKISVGEGTVLKIPPRLHSEVVDTDQSSDEKLENKDYTTHKRLKKALKKAKEKLKRVDSENGDKISSGHHRKHKRKHKHKHACADIDRNLPALAVEKANKEENDSETDAADPEMNDHQRPRLLYTWRRNSGLSRVESETSGNNALSAGDLKNDEKSPQNPLLDNSLETKSDSSGESTDGFNTNSANGVSDSDSEYGEDYAEKEFPGSRSPAADSLKPLMMKIQTKTVTKVETSEGRIIHVGDIVWGKIQGFPWWPGRVLSITVSTRDNGVVIAQLAHVSWFGSSTMSHMQCVDLYPFLEDFKLRYNKKKRGPYKVAIKQATVAAKSFLGTSNIKVEDIEL